MKLKGFALFEIAIALAIMGMVMSLSLPMLMKMMKYNQIQTTHTNQEIVFKALGAYAIRYSSIPCPAQTAQGVAQTSCNASSAQGIVPYADLNISRSYAVDGFGRFMTYAVTPEFAQRSQNYCSVQNPNNPITLSGMPNSALNPIVAVLVSHGSKGHGAFNENFHRMKLPSPGVSEEENANDDGIFSEFSPSLTHTQKFDHILKWASQDLFAQYYMGKPCISTLKDKEIKMKEPAF